LRIGAESRADGGDSVAGRERRGHAAGEIDRRIEARRGSRRQDDLVGHHQGADGEVNSGVAGYAKAAFAERGPGQQDIAVAVGNGGVGRERAPVAEIGKARESVKPLTITLPAASMAMLWPSSTACQGAGWGHLACAHGARKGHLPCRPTCGRCTAPVLRLRHWQVHDRGSKSRRRPARPHSLSRRPHDPLFQGGSVHQRPGAGGELPLRAAIPVWLRAGCARPAQPPGASADGSSIRPWRLPQPNGTRLDAHAREYAGRVLPLRIQRQWQHGPASRVLRAEPAAPPEPVDSNRSSPGTTLRLPESRSDSCPQPGWAP